MARGHAQGVQRKCGGNEEVPVADASASAAGFYDEHWGEVLDCGPSEPLIRDPEDLQVTGIPIGHFQVPVGLGDHLDSTTSFAPVAGFEHACNPAELAQHFVPLSRLQQSSEDSVLALSKAASDEGNHKETNQQSEASARTSALQQSDDAIRQRKRRSDQHREWKPSRTSRLQSDEQLVSTTVERSTLATTSIDTCPTYSFRIGDLDAVIDFFKQRFQELTTKPLKALVPIWLKLAEPNRKQHYGNGKYTYKTPGEDLSSTCYPPWWPADIPYKEPAHLKGPKLIRIAIHILLLHRYPDADGKRRVNWIYKLKAKTDLWIQCAESDCFASSKDPAYRDSMKQRATQEIFPEILDVAQSYEDHLAQLEERGTVASRESNAMLGKVHTWRPATKTIKKTRRSRSEHSESRTKRRRCDDAQPEPLQEEGSASNKRRVKSPSADVTRENTPCNDRNLEHFNRADLSPIVSPSGLNAASPPRAVRTLVPPSNFIPAAVAGPNGQPTSHHVFPSNGFCANCRCPHCCTPPTFNPIHGLPNTAFYPSYTAGPAHGHFMNTAVPDYTFFATSMEEKPQWSSFSSSDTVLDDTQGPVDFVGYNPLQADINGLTRQNIPQFPIPPQQFPHGSPMRF
ncbi:uncharacterized protein EI97DRAFT_459510 [Westerdykella ornata]|uniref:Subtelomeric hrmA-associated cluster protein AFUB-079030/YDR124W-like helical bundle domain-containing protein n=1 Tax=Westerdykella ornata TaxID=318751 RepID=A0A6A6JFV2_WESOR|nr:uncharacterized protein EI97DRAFT_459510 [Westerdykella ornata]KAF2275207.1 hypothetical protein EI97DRAFT_459510 [Westerdykella ornata]